MWAPFLFATLMFIKIRSALSVKSLSSVYLAEHTGLAHCFRGEQIETSIPGCVSSH